jgi:hypothetical protein
MPLKKEELKAQLMQQFEEQVDELLEKVNQHDDLLHLTQIEDMVLKARSEISAAITQRLVDTQTVTNVPGPLCPNCQQEMHYKGRNKKMVTTRSVEVEVE